MITTLTMNPCVDHTTTLDRLLVGETNHITAVRRDPSGKGINVSLALHSMGLHTLCLSYDHADGVLRHFLDLSGLEYAMVPAPGFLRTNIKLFDSSNRKMTECNESGAALSDGDVEAMRKLVKSNLSRSSALVLDGSVPPGVPDCFYRSLAEDAKQAGVPVLMDASGPLLAEGVKASPLLIKPNRFELESTFGLKVDSLSTASKACREIGEAYDIKYVCLSMGAEGALLVSGNDAWFSNGTAIQVRGVQGAGDSMIAGFCAGFAKGETDGGELLRLAVAAAHASLELEGTQMCDGAGVKDMLQRISATKLNF